MNTVAHSYFSKHAFDRLKQRTALTCNDVISILDLNLMVNLGGIPGFNRRHLLIYSVFDDDFFIVIQDYLTGIIVTILPIEYHENIAWNISMKDKDKAKEILIRSEFGSKKIDQFFQKQKLPVPAKNFVINAYFVDKFGMQKSQFILKVKSNNYHNEARHLISDSRIMSEIQDIIKKKLANFDSAFAISIRLGSHGDPVIIDLDY